MKEIIPAERIQQAIYLIRGQKALLSIDLAKLYDVEPRVLVQAVKRNINRFPPDFMFQLNKQELINLKSQIVISSWGGMRRARPYAFTEQGVAMLSSVLNSPRAIHVNIAIMRTFPAAAVPGLSSETGQKTAGFGTQGGVASREHPCAL